MRRPDALRIVKELVRRVRERGVRVVAYAIMGNHVHLLVSAVSGRALGDAMRYFFSLMARRLNALFERSGPFWEERFASRVARNAKQLWHTLNYVLRNPFAANCPEAFPNIDPYLGIDDGAIDDDRFLRGVFGPKGQPLTELLLTMIHDKVPWTPVTKRLQLRLI